MAVRKSKKSSWTRSLVWKEMEHFGRCGRQGRKSRLRTEVKSQTEQLSILEEAVENSK